MKMCILCILEIGLIWIFIFHFTAVPNAKNILNQECQLLLSYFVFGRSLVLGILVAIPSGAGVALSVLGR